MLLALHKKVPLCRSDAFVSSVYVAVIEMHQCFVTIGLLGLWFMFVYLSGPGAAMFAVWADALLPFIQGPQNNGEGILLRKELLTLASMVCA